MRFAAIDVETANADYGSICQIGACLFENGHETDSFCSLVNPGCHFDALNVGIHGITEDDVCDAPPFLGVLGEVRALARGTVLVAHGSFDRAALAKACAKANVAPIDSPWLDSVDLARWAWPDQAEKGYRLDALAERLGIEFEHHDAMHDARTAGLIAIAAIGALGVSLDEVVRRRGIVQPIATASPSGKMGGESRGRRDYSQYVAIRARDFGGGDGPLGGHRIVFTGAMVTARHKAAEMASALGAHCSESVSMKTTILVVGETDGETSAPLGGGFSIRLSTKSGKHVKAEKLNSQGASITIMRESEFLSLCGAAASG